MPSRSKTRKYRKSRKQRGSGSGLLSALQVPSQTPALPGGLSSVLPTDGWHRWTSTPEALQWGPKTEAPAPLANGGLYTNPQSTTPWASSPFPATQHAFALEAAKVSGLPEVAYHQRPNDNFGASFSPVMGTPITSNHWSASGPAGPIMQKAGARSKRTKRSAKKSRRNRK
jgi:hypothetical protein